MSQLPPYSPPPTKVTDRGPLPTDDSTIGYAVGNYWTVSGLGVWRCDSATAGKAEWTFLGSSAAPLLDIVAKAGSGDFAYGLVKLRTAYAGSCLQMRATIGGVVTTANIGFVPGPNGLYIADYMTADAFVASADAGTIVDARFYDQLNSNDSTFNSATNYTVGFILSSFLINALNKASPLRGVYADIPNSAATGGNQSLLIPSGVSLNVDGSWIIWIGKNQTAATELFCVPIQVGPYAGPKIGLIIADTDNGLAATYSPPGAVYDFGIVECGPVIMQLVSQPNSTTLYVNDASSTSSKSSGSGDAAIGGFLGYDGSGTPRIGGQDVLAVIGISRIPSATDIANAKLFAYRGLGIVPHVADQVIQIGESKGQGYIVTANQSWFVQTQRLVKRPFKWIADATGSKSWQTHNGQTSRTIPLLRPGATNIAVIAMCGYNDIVHGGLTAAQAYAQWVALCTTYRAAGFKIVAESPWAVVSSFVSTANQLALATMMAAAAPSLCDAYANLWANADIGQGANTGNTLLYYTDGIHLTAKGSGIPASLIAQGINSVVP